MNYRHDYHAGNFADVFKHAVLTLAIEHMKRKVAPFRVIDTHAGAGAYDLAGIEAGKTLEWLDGIGRILGVDAAPVAVGAADLLGPYLDIVRALNPSGRLSLYPGSPAIARALIRPVDTLVVNELRPEDYERLEARYRRDHNVKTLNLDGWTAVKSLLPPKERRGVVLIDPPFEARDEFTKMAAALLEARRRFATGVVICWLPIKDPAAPLAFRQAAQESGFDKMLYAELFVRAPKDVSRLNGCALLIANPPFAIDGKLAALGPFLAERLAQGDGAAFRLET